jgi:hypothetical protein
MGSCLFLRRVARAYVQTYVAITRRLLSPAALTVLHSTNRCRVSGVSPEFSLDGGPVGGTGLGRP